jgi:hypothetical protein
MEFLHALREEGRRRGRATTGINSPLDQVPGTAASANPRTDERDSWSGAGRRAGLSSPGATRGLGDGAGPQGPQPAPCPPSGGPANAGGRAILRTASGVASLTARDQPCFVSQKIFEISSILESSSSAWSTSALPLVPAAPASLVASLNSWCSWGYFSKCGGLK